MHWVAHTSRVSHWHYSDSHFCYWDLDENSKRFIKSRRKLQFFFINLDENSTSFLYISTKTWRVSYKCQRKLDKFLINRDENSTNFSKSRRELDNCLKHASWPKHDVFCLVHMALFFCYRLPLAWLLPRILTNFWIRNFLPIISFLNN